VSVLTSTLSTDERITTAHRAKLAYVYIRQSSPGQVRHHQESTALQYRLAERAALFGWPRERVHVIDDDLGKSGTSSRDRQGFQTLIAEVGLGKAGLVMSLDASRLARNNRDWHQLLELCSLFGVLIADGERLYDPAAYHDRLLLGLSGIMSEAELHQIKIRLHQGERQKAARGELRLPLPAGLIHNRDGSVTFNPDEEVQERLRMVFAKFRELRSAKAVMRYLRRGNLLLPVRPLHGPAPHDVVWQPANSARVTQILKNPAYAGAYVYGRRRPDPLRRQPGSERIGTVAVAPEEWSICLKDAHPAYLDWDEFMANRRQLADNVARYDVGRPGAPRKGDALLQGIVSCGRCARRMCLRYSGPNGDYPVYVCVADSNAEGRPRCQEVRALAVDAEIERLILTALTPDRITLAVAALGEIEQEARAMERQWALKCERARYDAERARRQYDAVEPENRLVARSLERVWEERLRRVDQIEQEYAAWRREQAVSISDSDRQEILSLGEDLPRLWHAATTRSADRKQIARLVIKEVALDQKRRRGYAWIRIIWQTGAASEHWLQRCVQSYAQHADQDRLRQRIAELNGLQKMDGEIAAILNEEALRTAHGPPFSGNMIHSLRKRWRIPTVKINGKTANPPRWPDGTYSVQGAAAAIGITPQVIFDWLRRGWLTGTQLAKGMPWQIALSSEQAIELRARVRRTTRSKREAS
jgi:DNA invertase Pin-like site-specific DNA recombinase